MTTSGAGRCVVVLLYCGTIRPDGTLTAPTVECSAQLTDSDRTGPGAAVRSAGGQSAAQRLRPRSPLAVGIKSMHGIGHTLRERLEPPVSPTIAQPRPHALSISVPTRHQRIALMTSWSCQAGGRAVGTASRRGGVGCGSAATPYRMRCRSGWSSPGARRARWSEGRAASAGPPGSPGTPLLLDDAKTRPGHASPPAASLCGCPLRRASALAACSGRFAWRMPAARTS